MTLWRFRERRLSARSATSHATHALALAAAPASLARPPVHRFMILGLASRLALVVNTATMVFVGSATTAALRAQARRSLSVLRALKTVLCSLESASSLAVKGDSEPPLEESAFRAAPTAAPALCQPATAPHAVKATLLMCFCSMEIAFPPVRLEHIQTAVRFRVVCLAILRAARAREAVPRIVQPAQRTLHIPWAAHVLPRALGLQMRKMSVKIAIVYAPVARVQALAIVLHALHLLPICK